MAMGMKVWDASGVEMLNESDRITRVLGIVASSTAAGSVTDSRFLTGTPWFALRTNADYGAQGKTVTFSGDTMSWTSGTYSADIIYGVY